MIHVAIDSSLGTSIALQKGECTDSRKNLDFGRDSDRAFLPALRGFLQSHQLDVQDVEAWTVGTGPGSFAGIRFALALVKGICTATKAKCRGIPSGYALACASGARRVSVLSDARCGKAFVSVFENEAGEARPIGSPLLVESESAWPSELDCPAYVTANPGLEEHLPNDVRLRLRILPPPEAVWLLQASTSLWPLLDDTNIEPLYVRPPA